MPSDKHNPYYAYIKLDIGNYSIDSRDDGGPLSLQAVYATEAFCTYTIEAYDDTAQALANAILSNGRKMYVEYGYTNGQGIKSLDVSVTNIHTELIGHNGGEIITLEAVPTALSKVMNSVNDASSCDRKFTGSATEILNQVIAEIGWQPGYIVATGHLRGENNGNDDLQNPDNYEYWSAEAPATEFMGKLTEFAKADDGRKNYVLAVHYRKDQPPTVDFFPTEDMSQRKTHYLTYGDPDSEIISINIDWGDALLVNAGFTGVISNNQDSITNDEWGNDQSMEYRQSSTSGAKKPITTEVQPAGGTLTKKKGTVTGPMGKETWYGTLKPGSPAFTYTLNAGGGNSSWQQYYREDGVLMWGPYVCVAADISGNYGAEPGYPALPDHVGKYERGDIVDTSLGEGIVVDACRAACDVDYPWFDVAVNW